MNVADVMLRCVVACSCGVVAINIYLFSTNAPVPFTLRVLLYAGVISAALEIGFIRDIETGQRDPDSLG